MGKTGKKRRLENRGKEKNEEVGKRLKGSKGLSTSFTCM